MRRQILAAGLLAGLCVAGCSKPAETTTDPAALAPKKSLARPAQKYANQELVDSVQSGTVEAAPSGAVLLKAAATTASAGWTRAGFLPRIYAATPPDGVYEVEVVAEKPATPGAATPTPIEVKGEWDKYTDGRVKGIKFISKTNEVVAMLPPKS